MIEIEEKNISKKILYKKCLTFDKPLVYVLRGENGDMLIDTAHEPSAKPIMRWIRKNGFNIKWIFLTHGHYDHVWNAAYLKEKYNAKVIIHEKDKKILNNEEFQWLHATTQKDKKSANYANYFSKDIKNPHCEPDYVLTDNDTDFLRKLGFDADIVMLPGHTHGSMGILQGRVLYCGDACAAKRGDYCTMSMAADSEKLLESEKKIFELNPLVIACGHGQLIINDRVKK